jgi:hypothetical protein
MQVSARPTFLSRWSMVFISAAAYGGPGRHASAMAGMPAVTTATGISMIIMHGLTGGSIAFLVPTQTHQ